MKQDKRSSLTLADYIKSQQFEDWVTRPIARAAKTTAKGLASFGDLANLPINAARGFAGYEPLQSPSEIVGNAFDQYTNGLTVPQNEFERGIDTAGEFITSGGPFGAASKTAPILGKLAAQTPKELIGTAAAGGGFQAGREMAPDSYAVPLVTSLAAGKAANAITSPQNALGKALSINPNKTAAFEQANLNPTLADISNSKFIKGTQNILAEAPFTSGIIGDAIQTTHRRISNFGNGLPQESAGKVAQEGMKSYITKANKLTERLKQSWEKDIIPSEKMQINKTSEVFSKKPAIFEPENVKAYENSTLGKLNDKLAAITERNNGEISVGDAMFIRNEIDDLISTFGSVGDATQGQLKNLRNSLSEDLKEFAHSKGEQTGRNFDRYNKFYNQYRTKLDKQIQPLLKNKTATKTFNSIKNNLRVDAADADTVLKMLKPQEKTIFSESLVRELGMNPQNEFNGATLATNFKKLEPKAQEVVLSGLPKETQKEFRASIEAIDHMKGTKAQSNPSGTFNQTFKLGTLGALWAAPISTSSVLGTGIIASKLMTSPKFINWLSEGMKVKNETQAANHIEKLSKVAKGNPELAPLINQYLQNLSQENEKESPASSVDSQKSINLESLSDQELLQQFSKSDEIKKLTNEQLEELSNLYKAMTPAKQ